MAFADSSTYKDCGDGSILGIFRESDTDIYFEFSANNDEIYKEYPHKVWVTTPRLGIDSGFRYARVLKTRCKILLDEGQVETWHFKQNSKKDYK
jgi:hypothetical protein